MADAIDSTARKDGTTAVDHIVVATDYSPSANHALVWAAILARQLKARIVVLHVLPAQRPQSDPSNLWGSGEDTVKKETARLAEHVAGQLAGAESLYETEVAWGEPASTIVAVARNRRSGAIVIGAQGIAPTLQGVLGSVAEAVLREAPCTVLTVRAPGEVRSNLPPTPPTTVSTGSTPTIEGIILGQTPVIISQDETLAVAHELMISNGIHQLPVVEGGALIGILAERDLHAHVGYLERTKVDAAMTRAPITLAPSDSAQHAARVLIEQNINSLPVVHADRLLGIVSRTDLLRLLLRLLDRPSG